MTKRITDQELHAAIDGAFDLWQSHFESDLPAHIFSADFEARAAAIPEDRPIRRCKPIRTAAAVAAIVATLTMAVGADVVPPAKTFHSGMVDVFSQVFPKSTDQIYTTDADHEGETRRPVLNWLPEGMVEVDRNELTTITRIDFENTKEKELYIFTQRLSSGATVSIDTEDAHVETIFINGNQGLISIKEGTTIIEWCIDNYACSVIGTIPTKAVLKVAENIELK